MLGPRRKLVDALLGRRRLVSATLAALLGCLTLAIGAGQGLDQVMREGRDALRAHPASGEVHIVEIDARSLDALGRWPVPRRYHGRLIDRLHDAGARAIAFDVDFSASSTAAEDAALATALERAGGSVILPTFRQQAGGSSSYSVDNIPAKPFRDNAFLAGVNVIPDGDGYVRRVPLGVETMGVTRPSLPSIVAERQASAGESFAVDFSIDPASVPRHSFIDLVEGRVPATAIAGKRIIVGATAIETGDRYAVPRHGVLPGFVIQALATETLLQGPVPRDAGGLLPLLLALALIGWTMRAGPRPLRCAVFALGGALILMLPLFGERMFALSFQLAPALSALAAAGLGALGLHLAQRFRHRALVDQNSGLANLAALEADAGQGAGLIVVARVDRFAAMAAGLGPAMTTSLVRRIAERLAFADGGRIYRVDEGSLAWIESQAGEDTLDQRLDTLCVMMRSPVDCGRPVDVTLTFGIAAAAAAGPKQQIANAALAAVHAAAGGKRWERFTGEASDETSWHLSLLSELDAAMAAGLVWNAYQPKLDLESGRIVGVEALVRWNHPTRGLIAPDQFIPLVEQHGRARDLTAHVLAGALADADRWREQGHDLGMAVNVSATLLADAEFVALVRSRLEACRLERDKITLEVTETAAMRDPDTAIAALESWRALGVQISIDDFGTGQSSLGYLQKLPATELKIDKSFIGALVGDRRNAVLVRSTIAMAHELGLKVVAEGVETADCLAQLREMGCDTVQGWLVGHPVAADAFEALLENRGRAAA
jgi:EAL domain-containing protein (putative c-di-GMP-specific phosphodiesterase class I)/CHASE2 domain-containing sensor protein